MTLPQAEQQVVHTSADVPPNPLDTEQQSRSQAQAQLQTLQTSAQAPMLPPSSMQLPPPAQPTVEDLLAINVHKLPAEWQAEMLAHPAYAHIDFRSLNQTRAWSGDFMEEGAH